MNFVTQAEVIDVITHKENLNEYILKLNRARKYTPGSFVQLTLDTVTASDIWPESRTFSIASYQKGTMRFIIKNVGQYTNRIFNELKVGSTCTIKYPFGELFDVNNVENTHVFIAGGVGVTPFLGLIEYFNQIGQLDNVYLFYSVKHEDDLLYLDFFEEILKNNLHIYITRNSSNQYLSRRMVKTDFFSVANDKSNTHFYICGSKNFNNDIKAQLLNDGYTKIHMDEWE